ncbi:hypothetical protein COV42_01665 [Candidatus Campbellbacteria bacterium CG11_big_fil_rev_8_21_14_0_20_44_21]|uniref:DUF192 domain-containing protein n=1 Tax=Candidatus Campbellbacteria bacterium CG22_combo_CG10-13_8_21_14_all_43_18 TaxID=1974530 RepID=A0A2H0DX69_9BACT|nr:MAG: hypothetical protein COW82_00260 [Candidatus Campbellbacteria bacterium CG22_combo_CG10-13_8_21_14_all_43_18]PIR24263.1 MAG: hypothetical protein COV42_01665 [Candidatus Campbellbacteria bacterium CG11_big_fil_rev_8_21_14_0_20_44_21]
MKKILYIIPAIILAALVYSFWSAAPPVDYSGVSAGEIIWKVEVAKSQKERSKGLSGRNSLAPLSGLLFVFPREDFHGIWMKEMRFPIDIIWFNENLEVVGLKKDAVPEDFPEVFKPEAPASFVLEINAGEAEKAQIKIKDILKIF